MAKKKSNGKSGGAGKNKSQAIRDYIAQNADAKPSQIAEALKEQGIEVTAQFVSTIKSNALRKEGKTGARGNRGRRPARSNGSANLNLLREVKKLADANGVEAVVEAATLYADLMK